MRQRNEKVHSIYSSARLKGIHTPNICIKKLYGIKHGLANTPLAVQQSIRKVEN